MVQVLYPRRPPLDVDVAGDHTATDLDERAPVAGNDNRDRGVCRHRREIHVVGGALFVELRPHGRVLELVARVAARERASGGEAVVGQAVGRIRHERRRRVVVQRELRRAERWCDDIASAERHASDDDVDRDDVRRNVRGLAE